jgi:phage terminase large subunit-like protein
MNQKPFIATPHPVLGLPTPAQMAALGYDKTAEVLLQREKLIRQEQADPFGHTWEPPIWKVCDALLGFPWVDKDWAERMRQHLGFSKPVKILLINGGQRGGKSQYASNRTMRLLRLGRGGNAPVRGWALHSSLQMSRDYQQPLFWLYLPPELKAKDIKTRTTYIAYKQKTGFSEEKFVMPDGADMLFKSYDQDRSGIEGGNLDIIWPDELVPSDWVETMELRIAEKNGWMVITFTPVEGYTETVRLFQDGAEVVKESVAFLSPRDGGEPDVPRALGLTEEEFAEVKRAESEGRASYYPQSRPEDCGKWIEEGGRSATSPTNLVNAGQPGIPAGREFMRVPRVMKCVGAEGKRAVVFFHSSDNPYGNPKNVWATIANKSPEFKLERFYGVASKVFSARFPKFNLKVHVVRPDQIPAEGTNYMVVDPAGRNFFISWYRVTPNRVYKYREWPGDYPIPGVGLPGPWAVPDGKHPDGKRGPAQKPFGWGHLRYKEEIARLEGWKDFKERPAGLNQEEWNEQVASWDAENGAREVVQERFIDSRFASTPKMENDRPVTLIEEFADLLLFFTPTPGDDIEEGVQLMQDALDYDDTRPVDFFNMPRYLVSSACQNSIYSLTTWTGFSKEGRRNLDGASKDPIDCDRYFFLSDCQYLGGAATSEEEEEESEFESKPEHYY